MQPWSIPKNASMVYMVLSGGGGGGGGGRSGTAPLEEQGGGAGGGSGAIATLLIPAVVLPKTLYLYLGAGGAGGAQNASGSLGAYTFVYEDPGFSPEIFFAGGGFGGNPGVNNNFTGATAGQAGEAAWFDYYEDRFCYGIYKTLTGKAGASGSFGFSPNGSNTYNGLRSGGAAGGCANSSGTSGTGGNVLGYLQGNSYVTLAYTDPAPGSDGAAGLNQMAYPFNFSGGSGGSAFFEAQGGSGGNGGPGCGGGGGGGGASGGIGGNGGPGYVIVSWW